jgi:hypothetical protein
MGESLTFQSSGFEPCQGQATVSISKNLTLIAPYWLVQGMDSVYVSAYSFSHEPKKNSVSS